jgi:eukaryotic-like serine/threonine-protein kinase
MDEPSVELLAKYRQGSEAAATELFRRYVSRLTVLARARLAPRIARRVDPEDIVMSAYRSFFVRARDGRFTLTRSGDLWRLLVGIVLKKLYHQAARHTAEKRSVGREVLLPAGGDSVWGVRGPPSTTPGPAEALALAELVENFMATLTSDERRVLELRLLDNRVTEIALAVGRHERTVRRLLTELENRLKSLLAGPDGTPISVPSNDPGSMTEPPLVSGVSEVVERNGNAEGVLATDSAEDPLPSSPAEPQPFYSDRDFLVQLHLGSGGTGRVYRAWHKGGKLTVALKMLRKASQNDPIAVERFLAEARTVSRLDHPGIVAVRGIGRTRGGGYFLVQEFVAGLNLSETVASRPITVIEALNWVAAAADAIAHAHRQGVVHCDLKPANLLLDDQGRIRITDFGFATIVSRGLGTRTAIGGTLGYMAPEQLDPAWGAIGPQTDIFGLGAVLFSLLAGRPPFSGTSTAELLQDMFTKSAGLSLRNHRGDVSPDVDSICLKCLALNPGDRFNDAEHLARAIRTRS